MRSAVFVLFAGLVLCAVGAFVGCGSLFTWNGRHAVDLYDLPPGQATHHTFEATRGSHYSAAVQIVFERPRAESASEAPDSETLIEAKIGVVASMKDGAGAEVAQTLGWIDPNEPPTVVYGRAARPTRGTPPELVAERLVGPWVARQDETGSLDVRIDTSGSKAPVASARVVVYDDRTPTSVLAGFAVLGAGVLTLLVAFALLVRAYLSGPSRRGGIRAGHVV